MTTWTLEQGKRYIITVSLDWVESFSPDVLVKTKFEDSGFSDVTVVDADGGKTRLVEGTWNHPTTTIPHDSHLAEIDELRAKHA